MAPIFLKVISIIWGFPCGSAGKESACNSGDLGSIPGLGRSPGEGKGYPLQYTGHGVYSPWGHKESDMIEWLSLECNCGRRLEEARWESAKRLAPTPSELLMGLHQGRQES